MDPKAFGSRLKERWNYFAAIAVVLTSIVGAFLLPPPASMTEQTPWFEFGRFFIALIAGLWFVPLVILSGPRTTWIWWFLSVTLVAISCVIFLKYANLREQWTVRYPISTTNKVVVGDSLRRSAQLYHDSLQKAEGREIDDAKLLWAEAGDVGALWHMEDIRRRERILIMLYLGSLALFASAVITIVQASYCVSQKRQGS